MVGCVHDFFLAATGELLEASAVAPATSWRQHTTSASYHAWPKKTDPARNNPSKNCKWWFLLFSCIDLNKVAVVCSLVGGRGDLAVSA